MRRLITPDLEADILLARVLELSPAQQTRVYEVLEEMLGEKRLGVKTERSRQVRARHQSVEAMRQAAEHLKLPAGQAPSVQEFKRAAKETEILMSFYAINRAFDLRWELAQRFYQELPIPQTAMQRRLQREHHKDGQDIIVSLRLWARATGAGKRATAAEYRAWAKEINDARPPGSRHMLEDTRRMRWLLGVSWRQAVLIAREESTLAQAKQATREERQATHETASRAREAIRHTYNVPPLACLQMFVSQDALPRTPTYRDYEQWAERANEERPDNAPRLLESYTHLRAILRMSWERCLAVARGEMTLEDGQALTLEEQVRETGPLVGNQLASWLLDLSLNGAHDKQAGYPQPVLILGRTLRLWRLQDIYAYKNGQRGFTHKRGELQGTYLGSEELAGLARLPQVVVNRRVETEMGQGKTEGEERNGTPGKEQNGTPGERKWNRIPRPAGRAGGRLYWERSRAEEWISAHPEAIGSKRGSRVFKTGIY